MNRSEILSILAVLIVCALAAPLRALNGVGDRHLDLIRGGQPMATLVLPADEVPIWAAAAKWMAEPAERWGGVTLKTIRLAAGAELPAGNVVVLGTPQTSRLIADLVTTTESHVSRVPFIDDHGFVIESREADGAKQLIIAGKTPRGAYNGAVACRDFFLDATAAPAGQADVFVRGGAVVRAPAMPARGTYCLSMYGVVMKYTAEDWKKIIDRHAEDGMNLICFWLSGHHPSEKFSQLYNVDATKGTRLTVEGVRNLIRYCHDRDIRFYIGGGVFAWTASHYLGQGRPEIHAVQAGGLCPSKPYAREANREHFLEMYRTWPEADGFMLEIRDEHGECHCEDCQKPVDEFGSKAYGKAEITWLQELAREAWKLNPKLRFCWLIGYAEHAKDVYYYDQIRRMSDPRFEWLDVRVSLDGNGRWVLPGPGGGPRPFAFFSRQISHWDPFYRHRIEHLMHWASRIANEGLYGYVPAFEPGFGSGSYYGNEIPFPVDRLPFDLTGLVYREVTWGPGLTMDQMKDRIHRRYFSADAPRRFTDDLMYLHQFSLDHWQELTSYGQPRYGYSGEPHETLTIAGELERVRTIAEEKARKEASEPLLRTLKALAVVSEDLTRMGEIEKAMDDHAAKASPKTLDGFQLMRRLIADTRDIYRRAVPDPNALTAAIAELGEP